MVRGRDGSPIVAGSEPPSGSLVLNAPITGGFPPWLIEFYQKPQNPYRLLLASGQSIYLYMFLAIAIILGFGLVLTVRSVTQELELARLKSDFVSTVSHEFKSPLTSIRQMAEMLQSGRVPSEERRQRYYDVLVEQSARLSSLVTNVLDLARIDEGRKAFQFESLDLAKVLRDLAETTQHRVGHEGFQVRAEIREPLPRVRGDVEALRQALSNVLNNAIQYSGEEREVEVDAWGEGGAVIVAVKDRGVGIPAEELGKVFDRFYRGSNEMTRSVRGSGLGLTLVKEIVDAHGGSVEVVSEVGRGSTFTIRLPTTMESDHGSDPHRRGRRQHPDGVGRRPLSRGLRRGGGEERDAGPG
jgi:signal transduction histidine kinase